MRSRSALDWTGTFLGAAAQSVWCGVLAAALTGSAWPPLSAFAAATMLAAAALTTWAGREDARVRPGRALLATVVVAGAAVLFVAGGSWAHDYVVWQVVRDVAFVAGVGLLGVLLGRDRTTPDGAVSRALRAFAALCAALAGAALAGAPLSWQAAAVAAVLVAGGLHIAVVRYRALTDQVADADRLRPWPWLLAVTAVIVGVLVVAALAGLLLDAGALRWLLDAGVAVLRYAGAALAYAIGWAGAGLMRALAWLAGLVDLHLPRTQPPQPVQGLSLPAVTHQASRHGSRLTRLLVIGGAAAAAVAASLAVVALALRRLRRGEPGDDRIVEEREAVRSVASAAAVAVGAIGRRLLRLAGGGRRRADTPAELVRLRYEQLEGRLAGLGLPRAPGTTVRDHLASCAGRPAAGPDLQSVAGLTGVYELARYSPHVVDEQQARRFEELARAFTPPAAPGRP
jgi:Domain of unknown function (DUF4129)